MKKILYPIMLIILTIIFFIITPKTNDKISPYQESTSHLLLPQKNVVIIAIDLDKNNLDLHSKESISKLRELNRKFKEIYGVNNVDSILNATVIDTLGDDIEVKQFINDNITNEELKDRINNFKNFPELKPYISNTADSLLFYIYFSYSTHPAVILENIEKIDSEINLSFTGRSPIIAITERLLSNDITILIPILFILVMMIFLTFRSAKAILFSWMIIILSVIFSFSLIRFSGIKITPLILLVPVFSLGLLSDYVIHFIYHLFYAPHNDNSFTIRKNLIYPLSLTALSTLTGFISLVYINASGHILLGTIIAISVVFTFIGVILWLPYLNLQKPQKTLLPRFSYYQSILFEKLYKFRKLLYVFLLIGIVWGITKLPNLRIEPYPIEQLPEKSTIREAENIINNNFFGALPFFIEIDSGETNNFLNKDSLQVLNDLHNEINDSPEIGYSYSLLTVLKRINYYFIGDEDSLLNSNEYDDFYPSLIEQFLLYYSSGVDPLEYESLVDPSYRFFSMKGYLKYENVESLNNFYQTIESLKEIIPSSWNIEVHGVLNELNNEKNGLAQNWIFSFAFGCFLIFITVLIFYKKIKLAVFSLIPGFISMILSFGIISVLEVKIDSFSIIFVAIITGLVIDYSIHTLSALDKLPKVKNIRDGFNYIMNYSGIPIFLSFLTSLFSFSVLFFSSFRGARNLGILLFASLVISYILSFYLLPIIILPKKIDMEIDNEKITNNNICTN